MGSNSTPKTTTPAKKLHGYKLKGREILKPGEHLKPNLFNPNPAKLQPSSSTLTKSEKSKNFTPRRNVSPVPGPVAFSPRNKIIQRKFVGLKNKNPRSTTTVDCKCGVKSPNVDGKRCLCLAYDTLRASQEEFFKKPSDVVIGKQCLGLDMETGEEEALKPGDSSVSRTKRGRENLLEEARKSVPESGKVLHLVQAFEKLLSLPKETKFDEDEVNEGNKKSKVMKRASPGLQPPSCALLCSPPELSLTEENAGLDRHVSVSFLWDSSSGSTSNNNSKGVRRSRRNSLESRGTTGWKEKQFKPTIQKPFKLRTEQRGIAKQEEFMNKVQKMMMEEERLRIPVAQGLPMTTLQPECLIKPEVKENTIPADLKLHSDIRAVERADFDHQVDVKMNLKEQYKTEREKQKTLGEEGEIRRLRKALVPKSQPMSYFDRPFIPTRSKKHPTIPREPKFNRVENRSRFSSSFCHGMMPVPSVRGSSRCLIFLELFIFVLNVLLILIFFHFI